MNCCICGDENKLGPARRYWSPDDGWRWGRFCPACKYLAKRRPKPTDYAYPESKKGGGLCGTDGEMDSYLDATN